MLFHFSQSFWIPHYQIFDASGQEIFKVKGPCCVCSGVCCTCDFPFEIFAGDTDGTPVGRVCKQYAGAVKEMFTDATNFSVTCKFYIIPIFFLFNFYKIEKSLL